MSTINLLPEDYLRRRAQRRANVMCAILFIIVMTGVMAADLVLEQSSRHTQQVRDSVNASYEDAARQIEQMQRLQSQKAAMLGKANDTAQLMERVPRSYLLGFITNAMPRGTSLTEFGLDVRASLTKDAAPGRGGSSAGQTKFAAGAAAGARPDSPSPTVVMDLVGMASTDDEVARFMSNLARNPVVASVDLVYSEEKTVDKDKSKAREFKVHLEMKAAADAIDGVRQAVEATSEPLAAATGGTQ